MEFLGEIGILGVSVEQGSEEAIPAATQCAYHVFLAPLNERNRATISVACSH
jgi:hypothetical protein